VQYLLIQVYIIIYITPKTVPYFLHLLIRLCQFVMNVFPVVFLAWVLVSVAFLASFLLLPAHFFPVPAVLAFAPVPVVAVVLVCDLELVVVHLILVESSLFGYSFPHFPIQKVVVKALWAVSLVYHVKLL